MSSPPLHSAPGAAPRLQLVGITKRYPAVVANSGVSLTVQPGEIHAVLGENGAGKSTLMKIIYGSVKPDEGSVMFNGQPVNVRNPQEASYPGRVRAWIERSRLTGVCELDIDARTIGRPLRL